MLMFGVQKCFRTCHRMSWSTQDVEKWIEVWYGSVFFSHVKINGATKDRQFPSAIIALVMKDQWDLKDPGWQKSSEKGWAPCRGCCSDTLLIQMIYFYSFLPWKHSENEDHGIRSHHFMANKWGNSGNSVRLYFWGLQNHCRWWLQPWN